METGKLIGVLTLIVAGGIVYQILVDKNSVPLANSLGGTVVSLAKLPYTQ